MRTNPDEDYPPIGPDPEPGAWRTLVRYFVTDHQPPLLVSAADIRFGVQVGPALPRCPGCGDAWYGVCPACVKWQS